VHLARDLLGGVLLPGGGGGREPRVIGTEPLRQRLEEGDARSGGELAVAGQDLARERHP
jgi:hypothetical protein